MGSALSFIDGALEDIRRAGLYRSFRVIEEVRGPRVTVDGREVLCFCSNDYLGIAQRPELVDAAAEAAREFGWGAGAARLLSGTTSWHVELEDRIARFKGEEAALFFPSAYMANLALVPSIADRETLILSDERNHASVVDACRLAHGRAEVYPHADLDAVIDLLRGNRSAKHRLIVTDALFSMDGDIAPLRELQGLATHYGADLVVDDTHGTGILGRNGRGTLEHLGLGGAVRFQSAGFGKALGSVGGFLVGPEDVIDLFRNRARSFLYTTAPPPAVCAAGMAALDLVESGDAERRVLQENAQYLREGLRSLGFDLGRSETPILPVVLGDNEQAVAASEKLWKAGFLVPAIRPPTVPEGESRLRISVTALHEPGHLDALLDVVRTV
jgi:8-amino-7-oxononanoate synthase